MPDYQDNTYGLPMNPLTRTSAMGWDMQPWPLQKFGKWKLPPESFRQNRMENPGITNASGMGMHASNPVGKTDIQDPEQIGVPEPVSAQDPAYSMHPMLMSMLSSLGGMQMPHAWGTPMEQMGPQWNGKKMTKTQLLTALGLPGLDWGGEAQGEEGNES